MLRTSLILVEAMRWKLIFLLSLIGMGMALATLYAVWALYFWLPIFAFYAFIIARKAQRRFFLHGFFVGLLNWVWVTGSHVLFFHTYAVRHPGVTAMGSARVSDSSTAIMALVAPAMRFLAHYSAPIPGASAVLIGLLCWIASKFVRSQAVTSVAA